MNAFPEMPTSFPDMFYSIALFHHFDHNFNHFGKAKNKGYRAFRPFISYQQNYES